MNGHRRLRHYGLLLLLTVFVCISHINTKMKVNSKSNPAADIMDQLKQRLQDEENKFYENLFTNSFGNLQSWKAKPVSPHLQAYKNSYKQRIKQLNPVYNPQLGKSFKNAASFLSLKDPIPSNQGSLYNFFINMQYVTNIDNIPLSGQGVEPWSATYWPIENGVISVRYNRNLSSNTIGVWDSSTNSWSSTYTLAESIGKYSQPSEWNSTPASQRQGYVDNVYSPSEKYDLLLGDTSFGLTSYLKWYSSQFENSNGDCASWYGICHGWSPASYRYPKAIKPITLTAADGVTQVTFLPNDVYALTSMFWANASYTTRFLGAECPYNDPSQIQSDPATGLYTDPQCNAINPGALVLALGNELGINKLNAILDPAADGEIWNQPIKSYTMRFFNVLTKTFSSSRAAGTEPVSSITSSTDPFMQFISSNLSSSTVNIVGVFLTYTYAVEVQEAHTDQPNQFYSKTDQTIAAIELDANNNIVGGSWLTNKHANFMWKPAESSIPTGKYDSVAPAWDGSTSGLNNLTYYAQNSSQYGQPLKTVVDYIANLASASN